MKKRNRSRRQRHHSAVTAWWNAFEKSAQRRRPTWTFERLEERYYFTASSMTGLEGWQWLAVSNDTAAGQQSVDAIQQDWYAQLSGASGQSGTSNLGFSSIPTDPYLNYQWHLLNVGQVVNPGQFQNLYGVPGQDINVVPAWDQGYSGAGVNVAVVDSGVQLDHPDLAANISTQYGYDALRNRPGGGPSGDDPDDAHGTAVAGLIAAVANNGIGGTGVAFGANIIPIKLTLNPPTENDWANEYVRAIGANGAPVDIYNNSWGPVGRSVSGPPVLTDAAGNEIPVGYIALTNAARLGRNGLGAIQLYASGNGAESFASAGSNGYVNSRYTIGVGMVDHDGTYLNSDGTSTKYGEMSPSVLVVAPSGSGPTDILNDFNTGSGIFTTDLTDGGLNLPPLPSGVELDIDTFPNTDYTSRFGGTSAATPIVAGVVALMLEANPNLTYRDVEEILVRSSRQNDDQDPSWITNLEPLFRDPFGHNPGPTNYPIDPAAPLYPSDESQWNDEIVYQLVPGTELTPAVQASTGTYFAATSTFMVTAVAGSPWDGWVANNLTVVFRTLPGDTPGALAELVDGKIRVTVTGDGVTWSDIQATVQRLGLGWDPMDPMSHYFDMEVFNPDGPFDPHDEAIRAPLFGGVDATGLESNLQRNPIYASYHPIADPITNPRPLSLFTNGAGYTVSYGRHTDAVEYGYAHGVVDAALAVALAKDWHIKDQNLPAEKTYIQGGTGHVKIRAAQVTDEASGEFVVPGGLSQATDGFSDYFNEFFKDVTVTTGMEATEEEPAVPDSIDPTSLPFTGDDPPVNNRGGFVTFDVPAIDPVTGASNLMSMEWVEVHVTVTGDANAMNYLRITLVSPDGTQSELTQQHYRPEDVLHRFQDIPVGLLVGFNNSITPQDENGTNTDTLDWVYSTNRIWGERSDSNPIFDEYGQLTLDEDGNLVYVERQVGLSGWELHFENYSGSDLDLSDVQVAFHGSPIGSSAGSVERIMGKVGVDAGRYLQNVDQVVGANDGVFNFNRYITAAVDTGTPFGSHDVRFSDATQEPFAGDVTVYAIDKSTGQRVAQFVTGYDGNFFFDLPEGEYTLGVEDSLGRTVLSGGTNYQDQWDVTIDTTDRFTRTSGEVNQVTGKVHYFDDLNFLLDPGVVPAGEVVFDGQVIGDLDGDGTQDPVDAGVYNVTVYADLNHTGKFEIGEPFTLTDSDGFYDLHVPTGTPNTFSIGVKPPADWSITSPASLFHLEYSKPGDLTDGVNFLIQPPSSPSGIGNGYIFGFVFNDKNGDGIQGQNEAGLAGRTVFIDADADGEFDAGEIYTVTNSAGAYQFGEVVTGNIRLDVVVAEPYVLTTPAAGSIDFSLAAGEAVTQKIFGIRNLAVDDFGDLVGAGFKTSGPDAARSTFVDGFSLGATVDGEVRSRNMVETAPGSGVYVESPALNGIGDDQVQNEASFDDEDGVVLLGGLLRPGANALQITVNGVGGYLQGWIDFNNDGTFSSDERVFTNLDLNPGTYQLVANAPQSLVNGQIVGARFRWGTANTDYFGYDIRGEVEDYLFSVKVPIAGDYNADDIVDNADFQLWSQTFGSTTDLRADGNHNGIIDIGDYTVWMDHKGASNPGAGSGAVALASLGPALAVAESSGGSAAVSSPLAAYELPSVIVGHTLDAPGVLPVASLSAASTDQALLLLVTDNAQSDGDAADDDTLAGTSAEHQSSADDLDLVLAAAFENETDWRYSL